MNYKNMLKQLINFIIQHQLCYCNIIFAILSLVIYFMKFKLNLQTDQLQRQSAHLLQVERNGNKNRHRLYSNEKLLRSVQLDHYRANRNQHRNCTSIQKELNTVISAMKDLTNLS